MRWSLRRLLQWVFFLVVLQVVVYFWSIKRPTKVRPKFKVHEPLQPAMGLDGTCSFKNCPKVKDGMLNVHLVPHSHIDVGWLKTVDQYYTGEKPPFDTTERGCVRCTLNTTIQELLKNPQRRFIFIEMKYLARYWQEADDTERESIRLLIKERRLELINGGWVMSDAGVTTYNDIIDQHTLGFNFISETFGACAHTRTAWHVDQFGHSREHASIFAQMGYDALVISRIDYQDLTNRKKNKDMELIWNTSPRNLKNRSTLFTHVTYDGYYAPAGFVLDSADSMSEVSERDALLFIKAVKYRAECYKSNHLLLPMGSDFGYKEAGRWFKYMDPLIEEVNKLGNSGGFKVNVVYSTPSCYTHYVNLEKLTFATKADDFHPYQSDHSTSWTGYYTTRGGLKKHIKLAGQILQSCKQLAIFAGLDASFNQVNVLRDQMAVAQHHDAITGTQKKHVLNDYNLLLSNATNACQSVMSEAYQKLWDRTEEDNNLSTVFCYGLNISSCPVSETKDQFLLTVYNPLSWTVLAPIRFPVRSKQLSITDADGYKVPYQTLPVPAHILSIPERKPTTTQTDAVLIGSLPPMSVTRFSIQQDADESQPHFDELLDNEDKITLENEYIALKFWKSTGLLYAIHNKERDMIETLNQEFYFYEGQDNVGRNSGAYVFRPKHPTTKRVGLDAPVTVRVVKGPLVQEVHQTFCPWVSQVVRLYKG
ncbi:lysosomal alpha-mannosidase-like, partial [Physella acuta]|uniref:lysosomal alpha-mannosidase-like n=1 Tax=Physella acuta TaxID=109671 RepID=UPI0027DB2AEE